MIRGLFMFALGAALVVFLLWLGNLPRQDSAGRGNPFGEYDRRLPVQR